MHLRSLTSMWLLALICGTAAAQTAEPRPTFEIADVHPSPHRTLPIQDGGALRGDRYIIRQATMLDLIVAAYGLDAASVQGRPSWLEMDRFDIIAKAPPGRRMRTSS